MNNLLIKFQNISFTLNHSKNIANNQNHTIKTTHPEVLYNTTVLRNVANFTKQNLS